MAGREKVIDGRTAPGISVTDMPGRRVADYSDAKWPSGSIRDFCKLYCSVYGDAVIRVVFPEALTYVNYIDALLR